MLLCSAVGDGRYRFASSLQGCKLARGRGKGGTVKPPEHSASLQMTPRSQLSLPPRCTPTDGVRQRTLAVRPGVRRSELIVIASGTPSCLTPNGSLHHPRLTWRHSDPPRASRVSRRRSLKLSDRVRPAGSGAQFIFVQLPTFDHPSPARYAL